MALSSGERFGAVIQARMGSSRLPGKMLMDLDGHRLLDQVVARTRRARDLDVVVVATSDRALDDPIAEACRDLDVPCFRGSEDDVLNRFAGAAADHELDLVARVCGDAPLTDPEGIDALVDAYRARPSADMVHARHATGWPIGAASDLMTRPALDRAEREARRPEEREHVTPYFDAPEAGFEVVALSGPSHHLETPFYMAVDYPEDLEWFRRLYAGCDAGLGGPDLDSVFKWIAETGDKPRVHDWAA